MNRKTTKRLDDLQAHVIRNYKRWFKTYSGLEGVDVGLKILNGDIVADCYSIIFHVIKKNHRARKKVPKFLPVRINGTIEHVATDVIESGRLKLHSIVMGDEASNDSSTAVGTISCFFNGASGTYVCSNMHVLGADLLDHGQLEYDSREGDIPRTVNFSNDSISLKADLIKGQYGGIDAAFALVHEADVLDTTIKEAGQFEGFLSLTNSNQGKETLSLFGQTSHTVGCQLVSLGAIKRTDFNGVFLTNLIKLSRCTEEGDSGGPVYDQKNRIVGIVVGRDNDFTYALNISDVIIFFQDSKL